jgi:hypothetical protein
MVTAENLKDEQICIQRAESTCDITKASRLRYACQLVLDGNLDEDAALAAREEIATAINARREAERSK